FVPDHRPNAMFDPGPLQMEAIQVLDRRPSRSMSTAIRRGDLEEARRIVHSGAKLNVRDEYQSFPLAEASELGDADFVEDLLNAGADPNLDGGDALRKAARHCKVDAAKVLLAHGASVNVADVNGETALMSSSTCADGVMAQVLLDAKADPNAKAKGGTTALMAAARNPRVAEKLINAGGIRGQRTTTGAQLRANRAIEVLRNFTKFVNLSERHWRKQIPKISRRVCRLISRELQPMYFDTVGTDLSEIVVRLLG
ncbi:MAG TPA: ankyrin repeat domain-containing protein, partial [Terriglobales bacterium]